MNKRIIKRIPGVKQVLSLLRMFKLSKNLFLKTAPGHYYSPIPDLDYVRNHRGDLFDRDQKACPGIQLNESNQIALIKELALFYGDVPFPDQKQKGSRYSFKNSFFGYGSAIILYSIMRYFRPRRIVEVGSGYSSAAMLDISDNFFGGSILFSFIEPFPERLLSLLSEQDKTMVNITTEIVQNAPLSIFTELGENDILFIDSSHVAKIGSDVVYLLTEILPILQPGVIVHIHDIYWPFEYPEDWVLSGRAWNEAYLVKAFLQFNSCFEILLFNSYLAIHHQDLINQYIPRFLPDGGSSLWIRKTS